MDRRLKFHTRISRRVETCRRQCRLPTRILLSRISRRVETEAPGSCGAQH